MDQDSEINFPEDRDEVDKYFSFTGFNDKETKEMARKVEELGGFVLTDATWNDSCTHVISRTFEKSEMVLAGLAGGRWVLNEDFVHNSFLTKSWARGRVFVHDECVISHRKNWKRLGRAGGAFYNMKAMFVMDDLETKEVYQRIVDAGGGQWVGGDLRKAKIRRFHGDHLTHIIIDPWVLEQKDWRFRDYQDWQRYERGVSMNSTDDGEGPGWRNGGMLFKLHYTFLMDKLLHPLEKIMENKYTIFDEKVQNMAKLRRRKRAELKIKLEKKFKRESVRKMKDHDVSSSDEDDLLVIKERYKEKERRKQPGRFYMEKSRPVVKESLCEKEVRKTEQSRLGGSRSRKREKSPDELVANLGYMESTRKKNKRSGGSQIIADPGRHFKVGPDGKSVFVDADRLIGDHGFAPLESRQSSYISNLAQSIKDIERSHSNQFGPGRSFKEEKWTGSVKTEKDSKFGIKQENKFKIQKQTIFKKEVVVDLDSDSDIEEVTVDHRKRVKLENKPVKQENKPLVHLDDDDIVIIIDDQEDFLPPGIVVLRDPSDLKAERNDDILYLPPDVRKVDLSEIERDVKDVKLMEVDRDWKVDSDDEIEIIDHLDRKPNLDELVRSLGPLPEITIDSSDSEDDETVDDPSEDDDIEIVPACNVASTELQMQDIFALEDGVSAIVNDSGIQLRNDMEISVDLEPLVSTSDIELVIRDVVPMDELIERQTETLYQEETLNVEYHPSTCSSEKVATIHPKPSQPSALKLLQQLNQTLLARQDMTAEHISISQVCGRTPQYNKHTTQKKQTVLVPVVNQALMEFTRLREGEEVCLVRRRGRRKTQKRIVDISEEDDIQSESDLVKILKILEGFTTSKNYPHPEILNCIFTKYFVSQKSPLVIKHAKDFLSKFFFLHFGEKGANRKVLMNVLLNSLREVSDRNLFKTFDINNPVDTRSAWTFFKSLLEQSEKFEEEQVNGCEELLKVLVKVFQTDFEIWWKHERSGRTGSFPVIFYALGGSDFISNCEQVVPGLFSRCLSPDTHTDLWYIRRLLAMTAMVTAHLDDRDNQGFLNQGSKVSLARAVAKQCHSVESNILSTELFLLQPNWFSYLVCKQIIETKSRRKIVSLGDLTKLFQGLSMRNKKDELIISENLIQKYFSFSYTHVLLRANWFFSNHNSDSNQKFGTFLEMKKLAQSSTKKETKEVKFRNNVKMTVKQQMRDLKTLTKFCTGAEIIDPESVVLRSLLFNMDKDEDRGWHPGLLE